MKGHIFKSDIALHVEGDLAPRQSRRMEAHLAECEECRVLADELRQSQNEIRGLRNEIVEASALNRVRSNVLAQVRAIEEHRTWLDRLGIWFWAYFRLKDAVLGTIALLLVGTAVWRATTTTYSPPFQGGVAAPSTKCCEASVEGRRQGRSETEALSSSVVLRKPHHRSRKNARRPPLLTQEENFVADSQPDDVVVKILTDDPDVVIYWLIDPKTGGF